MEEIRNLTIELIKHNAELEMSGIVFSYNDGKRFSFEDLINRSADNIRRIEQLETGIRNFLAGKYDCPHGTNFWEHCESCVTEHFEALLKGKQ